MHDARKIIPRIESAMKRVDPDAIVQGTFYDDVSELVFVTVVKGVRKARLTFHARLCDSANSRHVDEVIREGLERLKHQPIG